ncbi:MAG: hypothetical protein IPM42_00190 [Saprospiraceae bacterium]|nr:hypothetical protein [Saprospiraceae bacterium]
MKLKKNYLLLFIGVLLIGQATLLKPEAWGFYGHRLINRMAVFTLPTEMIGFYKKNIEYITEHAIDPDKRRYATKHEAVRHYIDIDHWDKIPFTEVPRDFEEAIIKHCVVKLVREKGDTVVLKKNIENDTIRFERGNIKLESDYTLFVKYWKKVIKPMYYEDEWKLSGYDFDEFFGTTHFQKKPVEIIIEDHFSPYGIVPYHLEAMLNKLTKSFSDKDLNGVLRNSAEFGHYISDAHVPLHTTKNYNGQLTDQLGIHAFWESRIPELFAEKEYDFFVGKADYIENPREYIWNIIIKAHGHLDSVLIIEKRLSKQFDSDRQFCFDERLNKTIRIQCPEYAEAYSKALGNMVEEQMRLSIHAIGSFWYTAWVNAGQPSLDKLTFVAYKPEEIKEDKNIQTRQHDN